MRRFLGWPGIGGIFVAWSWSKFKNWGDSVPSPGIGRILGFGLGVGLRVKFRSECFSFCPGLGVKFGSG